jgi:hypothetical protein
MDIPVILNGVSCTDTYDGALQKRRTIMWTLDLTLKGYIYGPIRSSNIIKFVDVNFRLPDVEDGQLRTAVGNTAISEHVTVQPGLTANGQPTTNANNTIPYTLINVSDDFGYINEIYSIDDLTT